MVLSLDLTERALQSIPLRLILLATLGDSDGVFESRIIAPEGKLLQRRATSKEIKNRANNGLLLRGERDAGCGLDVSVFDVERGLVGNSWYCFSLKNSAKM